MNKPIKSNESHTKADAKVKADKQAQKKAKKKLRKPPRSRLARLTIAVARLIVIGYLAILGTLIYKETSLVYPGAFMTDFTSVSGGGGGVETVTYPSTNSIQLSGRLIQQPGSTNYVLFFHGNASKAKFLDGWLRQLSEQFDANVMAAEYRGYEDDATPNERGVLEDCVAARDYLIDRYQIEPKDIILYGRSLGGGCAVAVASRGGAKALVLESTFDRLWLVAAERYPFVPVSMLMRNRFDSVAKITAYRGPLVQMHSPADSIVPFQRGRSLFDNAPCDPKHFIEVPGVDHNAGMPRAIIQQAAEKVAEMTTAVD